MNREVYSEKFYESLKLEKNSKIMAFKHYISELKKIADIKSVLDIGCGTGTFLSVFEEYGIEDICGIDCNTFDNMMEIPIEKYVCCDLSGLDKSLEELKKKIGGKKYDIACCLEVGEHLADYCSDSLVSLLTHYSNLILFSAAIPGQGGDAHINEQWPIFWEMLFESHGYTKVDFFRRKTWDIYEIPGYYRQNVYIYVNNKKISDYKELKEYLNTGGNEIMPRNVVHPTVYKYSINHTLLEFRSEKFPRVELEDKHVLNAKILLK